MHYVRSVPFGAGTRLMRDIFNDNNRQTTMSLMALFKALMSLKLKPGEALDSLLLRHGLILNRLRGWSPPIVLPDTLHVACILAALPSVPFEPVKHTISARDTINLFVAQRMLRSPKPRQNTSNKNWVGIAPLRQ